MLATATLLLILQYNSYFSNRRQIVSSLKSYSEINSLHAQVMFLNIFSTRLSLNTTTPADLAAFTDDVNLLDSLTSSIPLSVTSQLIYSDGSKQTMLLSFAINKLISEAQAITSGLASPTFFIQYNSVNGLDISCEQAEYLIIKNARENVSKAISQPLMYFLICLSVFILILIVKNVILRNVLQKKS